jgi:succinoglycan biosynthesis protein ExoM
VLVKELVMIVSICIITYQRPEGLKRLLLALERLEFDRIEIPQIEVVVVDNDRAGIARQICERLAPTYRWLLVAGSESQRGISYARNRAISIATDRAEFLVSIDDDEIPEPQWLEQLLLVQQQYQADVVAGPVIPRFATNVPKWVERGKFFDLPRYRTGDSIEVAFAGNVLVRASILKQMPKPFDERFSLTGGEDSDLFMRLYQSGYQLVWADEAIAYEGVPATRTTKKYILQRGYRSWSTHSLLEKELYPSLKVQAIRTLKGLALIAIGLLLLIPSLVRGEHELIKALRSICRGCGTIAGLIGIHYEEYR